MTNDCSFSPCRRFRYTLEHFMDPVLPRRSILWIGLNPSTADESKLDPTLRRVRAFSAGWGFTSFVMVNLFAFRATDPRHMFAETAPIGELNDDLILRAARTCERVVAAWGTNGEHMRRGDAVTRLLRSAGHTLHCVGRNLDGSPRHPLYVPSAQPLEVFAA